MARWRGQTRFVGDSKNKVVNLNLASCSWVERHDFLVMTHDPPCTTIDHVPATKVTFFSQVGGKYQPGRVMMSSVHTVLTRFTSSWLYCWL